MKEYKLFINNEWVDSESDEVIEVENPATFEIIGRVPRGNEADVNKAVAAAKAAFPAWSHTAPAERARLLRNLSAALDKHKDELALCVSQELGIPLKYSYDYHIASGISDCADFADICENYVYDEEYDWGIIAREPVGVVAGIIPWNYPLNQGTLKAFAAFAAGCTIVLKPSQMTPLVACLFAECVKEAGFPAGVFNLVTGVGGEVGNILASHKDIDALSFTGSTVGGIEVGKRSLDTMKKLCLELGGKSPCVALPGSDYKGAVANACAEVFMNTGQTCSALSRLVVPRADLAEIEKLLLEEAAGYIVGDPMAEDSVVGPLASRKQFDKVKKYIQIGIDEGACLICGGIPEEPTKGYYVQPTIFMDVTNDMRIAREEIFGPVLSVIAYDTVEEALEIANDTEYGLAASVWAKTQEEGLAFAREIRTGWCPVNGAMGGPFPWGGYKMSGLGRENTKYGFEEFLEVKAINLAK